MSQQFVMGTVSFQELSPRERLAALFDEGDSVELLGPFDRIASPWLAQQGSVSQSDDGVIVARGRIEGREVLGVAIEPRHEGGSIGEVGGAKIALALQLAAGSNRAGQPVAAVLLLETGGVRLQEATLGLAAIGEIHSAIVDLRQFAPVVAVVAGPIGCFGGMSLAAALCTQIIGTAHGRLGMNGAEVIEQEAGPEELDASDRDLVWQLVGSEMRLRDGFIDQLVEATAPSISAAVRDALRSGAAATPLRLQGGLGRLTELRRDFGGERALPRPRPDPFAPVERATGSQDRGRFWLQQLSDGEVTPILGTPSILRADVCLGPNSWDRALAIAIVRDASSLLPRAAHGELGLEQAWTLAEGVREFVAQEREAAIKRPILVIVDSPGQAFGRIEEERCISVAAAAAVDAYAMARTAGHMVLTLIVGKAMSGSYLTHGAQSDHICALEDDGVSMHAMSLHSVARVTRRTVAEVEANSARILPMSYAIGDAYRLGLIAALLPGIRADAPSGDELERVKYYLSEKLTQLRHSGRVVRGLEDNPYRQSTAAVGHAMREQWAALDRAETRS